MLQRISRSVCVGGGGEEDGGLARLTDILGREVLQNALLWATTARVHVIRHFTMGFTRLDGSLRNAWSFMQKVSYGTNHGRSLPAEP